MRIVEREGDNDDGRNLPSRNILKLFSLIGRPADDRLNCTLHSTK